MPHQAEATVTPGHQNIRGASRSLARHFALAVLHCMALSFYVVGRGLTKLFRAPRTETGVAEAILGFFIVMGLLVGLVRLSIRVLLAILMR